MKLKLNNQYILNLFCTLLIIVNISCNNRNLSDKNNQLGQTKTDIKLLKFTSGVRSFLEDTKGNIWFGSYNEGVCLLHNGKFQYFTTENGLSHNQIRNIYEDKNGVIWFECGKGLSIYDGKKIIIYKERNYDLTKHWKLNDSDLWFKGDEIEGYNKLENNPGVYQYDGKKLSYRTFPVTPKSEDERRFGYAISTPFLKGKNGTIWFGTYNALIGYNGTNFKIITDDYLGLQKENGFLHIRGILEDSKGNLWIANNGKGVLIYDGKEAINFTAKQKLTKEDTKGNSLDRAFSLGEDSKGNIWIGTVESGVWRYNGNSVTNFTKKDGLDSKQIWLIHKSKNGELLFGGANPSGVYQFNGKSFERKY
ncbi:two-component regulator propeller domain-containing protein [Flavobacterium sp. HJJ]|uniref:ligand-binding sensor domain-containing protein n=1 Tax=Flavobacterium sp. HJJ TaxID=2783792 RepID=UPI00188AAB14|nr:two-component regulator propeller domain-containing protein [Flavobacterium sp. HJJ]MBF4471125.1 diguanylate cyclase [Flavobacterium sp. HJJ]